MSLPRLVLLFLLAAAGLAPAQWQLALPGWKYAFPRDHGNHPAFKTEWWYFTGNLRAADGHEFGYQLTFFRQGVGNGEEDVIPLSRFVTRDLKLAHFAVSDLTGGKFFFQQKLSRGAYGEAGFQLGSRLAWIDDWSCELQPDGTVLLRAKNDGASIDLRLTSQKAPVIHGANGVSQKAEGAGRASHYYSLTRLATTGAVTIGENRHEVEGTSWFDHEWATNQLAANQEGWDWISLQFDDGAEAMLFQLRLRGGGRDSHSGGTFVAPDGSTVAVGDGDFQLEPTQWWESPTSKGRYPVAWKLAIPKLQLELTLRAAMENQELNLSPISYWEGAIRAEGTRAGRTLTGRGYLEMTGYAGRIVGLQAGGD